jgi:hypothetical protein
MKAHLLWLFTVINLILLVGSASANNLAVSAGAPLAAPVGTAFTYQGLLRSSSKPFNGRCDFQFSLWDTVSGGTRIGGVLASNNAAVAEGRFTVSLDFGAAAFDGNGRWLQVAVRCPAGRGGFTTLAPRQARASAPYATRASAASTVPWSGITGKPAGFADDVDNGATVPLNLVGSVTSPGGVISATNNGNGVGVIGKGPIGVVGTSPADSGTGVLGEATQGTKPFGVWGQSATGQNWIPSDSFTGIIGTATDGIGVWGSSDTYIGVYGFTNNTNGFGVYGTANGTSGYAGYFNGKVLVNGSFDATAVTSRVKNFKIDHPLDPANKYLVHASVESSDMKNIYDGVVTLDATGAATVALPDWFEALNQDFRYQLTAIGAPGPNLYIAQEITGNRFAIGGGTPGMKVSWQVTGIRHDPYAEQHRMQVEEAKPAQERGTYLYPQGYGQPATKGETYTKQQSVQVQSQSNKQSKAP